MLSFELADADATMAFGARLARALNENAGTVIYLHGDLGAGKTTLARGFLRACGVSGTLRSPTYTLIEPYEARGRRLLHMDLYRLNDPAELEQLGLNDFPPDETLWLVEWPERGAGHLPAAQVSVRLSMENEGRRVQLEGVPAASFK